MILYMCSNTERVLDITHEVYILYFSLLNMLNKDDRRNIKRKETKIKCYQRI